MPLLSLPELRARTAAKGNFSKSVSESKAEIRRGSIKSLVENDPIDVFLSHRFLDAPDVLLVKALLEDYYDLNVFVDFVEEELQDRSQITAARAEILRMAMKRSSCLILAATENADSSQWIPWELGYCDGLHGKVAVFPLTEQPTTETVYVGREYLGLYPFIRKSVFVCTDDELWLESPTGKLVGRLDKWINDPPPHKELSRG